MSASLLEAIFPSRVDHVSVFAHPSEHETLNVRFKFALLVWAQTSFWGIQVTITVPMAMTIKTMTMTMTITICGWVGGDATYRGEFWVRDRGPYFDKR